MPRISAFYGIVIWMYHDEAHHGGRPHFHARYGDDEATFDMESLAILAGNLPPRGRRLVIEWARAHQPELRETGFARATISRSFRLSRCAKRSTIAVMRSTPLLTEARPLDGYAVHVRFEDGTTADVDLAYLLDYGGVFEPLRDPAYFARLRADAEAGTIVWLNDADIAPEALFARAQQRVTATA
jgi:hypothetical protein